MVMVITEVSQCFCPQHNLEDFVATAGRCPVKKHTRIHAKWYNRLNIPCPARAVNGFAPHTRRP
jgi:hypothetical protein